MCLNPILGTCFQKVYVTRLGFKITNPLCPLSQSLIHEGHLSFMTKMQNDQLHTSSLSVQELNLQDMTEKWLNLSLKAVTQQL